MFVLGIADPPLFVTSNRSIPVQNTSDLTSSCVCACVIIELFPVVSYPDRAVHRFDFHLLINQTPNIWRSLAFKELRHEVTDSHVFGTSCMFPPDFTQALQVNCLSKTKYHQDTALRCMYGSFTFNGSQSKTTQI